MGAERPLIESAAPSVYVLDTYTLYWYWKEPHHLSPGAEAALLEIERSQAVGLAPLIVFAELHYLTVKLRRGLTVEEILRLVDQAPSLRLEALTRRHLLAFSRLSDVPEMHDRFIGAVGLLHDAPIITRDSVLRDHPAVRTVW